MDLSTCIRRYQWSRLRATKMLLVIGLIFYGTILVFYTFSTEKTYYLESDRDDHHTNASGPHSDPSYSSLLPYRPQLSVNLPSRPSLNGESRDRHGLCPPRTYAAGRWSFSPSATQIEKPRVSDSQDALRMAGFTNSCASDREFLWHLGADRPDMWHRFPNVTAYKWVPGGGCDMREWVQEEMVRGLVKDGGWLLIGDSVTENHFFSLSCLLSPHVRATPNYTLHIPPPNAEPYDRAWPQHLYLQTSSPLYPKLQEEGAFPDGFDIARTPLVSFRRVDLAWTKDELENIHRVVYPRLYQSEGKSEENEFKLFSDTAQWSLSPHDYMNMFNVPLPLGGYNTLILSTGGHWTTIAFQGYRSDVPKYWKDGIGEHQADAEEGMEGLLIFFGESMKRWAGVVQGYMDEAIHRKTKIETTRKWWKWSSSLSWGSNLHYRKGNSGRTPRPRPDHDHHRAISEVKKKIIVRPYLPGHPNCHSTHNPLETVQKLGRGSLWNWGYIDEFNRIFEGVLSSPIYPDIYFLPIDRPGLLRPDAHSTSDCLHVMAGAGVTEGWTKYIWHYVTRET